MYKEIKKLLDSISGDVEKFYSQCPAGKRGRPMTLANAQKQEKFAPGSVCAKTAKKRGQRGERSIFYRITSWPKKPLVKKQNKKNSNISNPNQDDSTAKQEKILDISEEKKIRSPDIGGKITPNGTDKYLSADRIYPGTKWGNDIYGRNKKLSDLLQEGDIIKTSGTSGRDGQISPIVAIEKDKNGEPKFYILKNSYNGHIVEEKYAVEDLNRDKFLNNNGKRYIVRKGNLHEVI